MMAGAPGTGVPNPYPLAINTPLDRAYLRPLQEPLYDTETFKFSSPPSSLTYFQRPISQTDASGLITKTEAETNINQSSMLDYPREFSILGFNVAIDSTIGLRAIAEIYRRCAFNFVFSGRRPYLTVPFNRLPAGQGLEGAVAAASSYDSGTNTSGVVSSFKNGMGHIANYYKFNLGRSALKIKPGEAFNAKLGWPVAVPTGKVGVDTLNDVYGETQTTPGGWFVAVYIVG